MKKIFTCMAVAAVFGLTACNNQPQKNDTKAETKAEAGTTEGKIAYVEMDSIATQYKYCQEMTKELQQKQNNKDNAVKNKLQALQQAANSFQQKYQQNQFKSQEEFSRAQASLQQQQEDGQALEARLNNELSDAAMQYQQAVIDSVQHFLAEYNKTKKYSMIVPKSAILYGDKALDITNDVVAGLNKGYKGMKK